MTTERARHVPELTRYVIKEDGDVFKIWDTRLNGFCGLPDEFYYQQELEFGSRMEALDWLRQCHEDGLDVLGHRGITIKVYEAKAGDDVARHVKTVAEPPGTPDYWAGGLRG